MKNKKEEKVGKLNITEIKALLNKKAGMNVAHTLNEESPSSVRQWIKTGSSWLDAIICRGKMAGLPVGKIIELAGLEGTGKSYMAGQIARKCPKDGNNSGLF